MKRVVLVLMLAASAAFGAGATKAPTTATAAPVYSVAMSAALWQETINSIRRTDALTSREADSLIGIIAGQVNDAAKRAAAAAAKKK